MADLDDVVTELQAIREALEDTNRRLGWIDTNTENIESTLRSIESRVSTIEDNTDS